MSRQFREYQQSLIAQLCKDAKCSEEEAAATLQAEAWDYDEAYNDIKFGWRINEQE